MKRIYFFSLLGMIFLGQGVRADQAFWVRIDTKYSFQDMDLTCSDSTTPLQTFYFVGEVSGAGQVTHAELRDGTDDAMSVAVFNPEETSQVQVLMDSMGSLWVKSFVLDTTLLGWVMMNVTTYDGSPYTCVPQQSIASVSPESATFSFSQESATAYFTPVLHFEGTLSDGGDYSASMGFTESLFPVPTNNRRCEERSDEAVSWRLLRPFGLAMTK